MSDVSKTSDLIAEARSNVKKAADAAPSNVSKLILKGAVEDSRMRLLVQLADALEQADAYIQSMTLKESAFFDMEDRALKAEYALEAATERYEKAEHDRLYWRRRYQSMHKRAKAAEAERDATLAAIERVRDILNRDDFGDDWEHDEWVYRDAAEKKLADIEAALDSGIDTSTAPQNYRPNCKCSAALDWAPELTLDPDVIEFRDWTSISYEWNEARTMQRTVVKGDWERLPVEGESNNA